MTVIISALVIFGYFALLAEITDRKTDDIAREKNTGNYSTADDVDDAHNGTIVAYSLLKRLEIESREYFCKDMQNGVGKLDNGDDDDDDENRFEEKVEDINKDTSNFWKRVEDGVHVYSVHWDRRLRSHVYLRIVAMIRGK